MNKKTKEWRDYEEVATYILNELASFFNLAAVEGKQPVLGACGTSWEIDAKGINEGNSGFILIEVRRNTTSGLSQEKLAAIALRVQDTGADGGIVVSPLPLQKGAKKVANHHNIIAVQLNENSTTTEYIVRFLKSVMMKLATEVVVVSIPIIVRGSLTSVLDDSSKLGSCESDI